MPRDGLVFLHEFRLLKESEISTSGVGLNYVGHRTCFVYWADWYYLCLNLLLFIGRDGIINVLLLDIWIYPLPFAWIATKSIFLSVIPTRESHWRSTVEFLQRNETGNFIHRCDFIKPIVFGSDRLHHPLLIYERMQWNGYTAWPNLKYEYLRSMLHLTWLDNALHCRVAPGNMRTAYCWISTVANCKKLYGQLLGFCGTILIILSNIWNGQDV